MIIFLALLIPLIAVVILTLQFAKRITWWEYLLVFGVPAIIIVVAKFASTFNQTWTPEYWNNYIVQATYYEYWNEWIHKTCYETCYDECKDSEGRVSDCNPHNCNPYDCSYEESHPPYWEAINNQGHALRINERFFQQLCLQWNNRTFKDMNRSYHTVDGNAFVTKADTLFNHMVPYTSQHTYENRVKCSRSVFNFAEVDSEDVKEYGLYTYPSISEFNYNPILGWSNAIASQRLQRYNAKLGMVKQVHMLVLVFVNKPVQAAILQEGYWKGGNKNEFILCIGLQDRKVDWAKVISWTEVDELKIRVQQTVMGMPFDLPKIIDYMAGEVGKHFVRKHFKDFSYIKVEPTGTAIIITYILTFLITIGLCIFVIKNDLDPERH